MKQRDEKKKEGKKKSGRDVKMRDDTTANGSSHQILKTEAQEFASTRERVHLVGARAKKKRASLSSRAPQTKTIISPKKHHSVVILSSKQPRSLYLSDLSLVPNLNQPSGLSAKFHSSQ